MPKQELAIGAHTSIAGGLHRAIERGAALGCDVIQIFTSSNQQWDAKPLSDEDVGRWVEARARTSVRPAMVHSSYLVNLASPPSEIRERSIDALARDYDRCGRLAIPNLVVHPGAHVGDGDAQGIARIAAALDELFDRQPENGTLVLLENSAGQGTSIGHRFEHLRDILGTVRAAKRVGICIDTCHAFAAGHDIGTDRGLRAFWSSLDEVVGLVRVRAFHLNDSRTPQGGLIDRHAHIGRGHLGLEPFRRIVTDARFVGLPMVIETPKTDERADAINLSILRTLARRGGLEKAARQLIEEPIEEGRRHQQG